MRLELLPPRAGDPGDLSVAERQLVYAPGASCRGSTPHPGLLVEKLFDLRPGTVQTMIRPQLRLLWTVVFTATRLPSAASFVISPRVENTTSGLLDRARPRTMAGVDGVRNRILKPSGLATARSRLPSCSGRPPRARRRPNGKRRVGGRTKHPPPAPSSTVTLPRRCSRRATTSSLHVGVEVGGRKGGRRAGDGIGDPVARRKPPAPLPEHDREPGRIGRRGRPGADGEATFPSVQVGERQRRRAVSRRDGAGRAEPTGAVSNLIDTTT